MRFGRTDPHSSPRVLLLALVFPVISHFFPAFPKMKTKVQEMKNDIAITNSPRMKYRYFTASIALLLCFLAPIQANPTFDSAGGRFARQIFRKAAAALRPMIAADLAKALEKLKT